MEGVGGVSMFVRTTSATRNVGGSDSSRKTATDADRTTDGSLKTLDTERKARVAELRAIDRNVRAHEAAHQAAGGAAAGGMTLHYTEGPDGKQYATAGEVQIDLSTGATPDQTIAKMETVQRAANAPADPSPQDMRVAAEARAIEEQARSEKNDRSANSSGGSGSATARRATAAYAAAGAIGGSAPGAVASISA